VFHHSISTARLPRLFLAALIALSAAFVTANAQTAPKKAAPAAKPAAPAKPAAGAAKPGAASSSAAGHTTTTSHGPTTAGHTTTTTAGRTTTTTAGSHTTTTSAGKTATTAHTTAGTTARTPAGSHEVRTANGSTVRTRANGSRADVHDAKRNMDIHHGLDGGRRVSVERRDGSRLVAERGRPGYVQRGYNFHGHEFARRSYYFHGRQYDRFYRGYGYRGVELNVYAPGYYFAPGFYGWAYNPWAAPIAYGWGWGGNPWYGFYGGYFTPFAVYPSAAFWLTDYLIAADLQAAYAAAAGDGGGGGAVQVLANQHWTDTGTQIVQGQTYTINAGGAVNWAANAPAGPAGGGGPTTPGYLAPTLPPHSLIGMIGDAGAPFAVGPHRTFVAPVSGELFLGMNDEINPDGYWDNSGAWQATVVVPAGAAPPPPGETAGLAPLTPEVKQLIADEVKNQLALENVEAAQTAQNQDVDPGSSGIARLISDGHAHMFVVGGGLDVIDASSGKECHVSDGDALQLLAPPAADATAANLVVRASKSGVECAPGSTVTVNLTDLQEMQNHMRENIDVGLKELQTKQGSGGLPQAPPSAQAAPAQPQYAAVAPPPNPQDAADIQDQNKQADQAEQEVAGSLPPAAPGAPSPVAPAPVAPPPPTTTTTIALGQTPDQVTAGMGAPTRIIDLGTKKIYVYKDMKITFKAGKVSDIE